jgi:hypothetical protein
MKWSWKNLPATEVAIQQGCEAMWFRSVKHCAGENHVPAMQPTE